MVELQQEMGIQVILGNVGPTLLASFKSLCWTFQNVFGTL